MAFTHAILKYANAGFASRAARWVNRYASPKSPRAVRVDGMLVYARTLDRLAALWMRKLSRAEQFEVELWNRLIAPGMVVADVGANLGLFTLAAAKRARPGGRVHSFEPEPENFELLSRAVEANGCDNVTLHRAAVAEKSGRATLFFREEHRGDHRIYGKTVEGRLPLDVPLTTLDDAVEPPSSLDLVKLDIQGAEWRALQGMRRQIQANPEIRIVSEFFPAGMRESGGDPREFLAAIRDLGLEHRNIDNRRGRLVRLSDRELIAAAEASRYTNILLAREPDVLPIPNSERRSAAAA